MYLGDFPSSFTFFDVHSFLLVKCLHRPNVWRSGCHRSLNILHNGEGNLSWGGFFFMLLEFIAPNSIQKNRDKKIKRINKKNNKKKKYKYIKTRLLRKVQAQTLSNSTPLIGKINPFSHNLWTKGEILISFVRSEEPTETNIWVQFRVNPSFKLLHWKGFFCPNCPGVTKTLPLATEALKF